MFPQLLGNGGKGHSEIAPVTRITKTLDSARKESFLADERIDLLKIDVQGAELEVLKGAAGTLLRCGFPPILYEAWAFEWYAPKKAALEAFLQGLGYVLLNFDGSENFVAQHPAFGAMIGLR